MSQRPRMPRMPGRQQGPQNRPNKRPGNYPYHHWDNCDDWYWDDWYWDDWWYDDWYDWDWDWDYRGVETAPRAPQQNKQPTPQQAYKKGFSDGVRYATEKNKPMPEPTPEPGPTPTPPTGNKG